MSKTTVSKYSLFDPLQTFVHTEGLLPPIDEEYSFSLRNERGCDGKQLLAVLLSRPGINGILLWEDLFIHSTLPRLPRTENHKSWTELVSLIWFSSSELSSHLIFCKITNFILLQRILISPSIFSWIAMRTFVCYCDSLKKILFCFVFSWTWGSDLVWR